MMSIKTIVTASILVSAVLIGMSQGRSYVKRDVGDDIENAFDDVVPKGGYCATDAQCSSIEICTSDFQCTLAPWFIGIIIGVAIVLLLSVIVSCICCPCCILYSLCRKG